MATNDREIERKYLLSALPSAAAAAPMVEMDQGYLPGEKILERVRRVTGAGGVRYYRTVKVGSGIERLEFEEETTEDFFRAVWPLTRGKRVQKRRYVVRAGARLWEIDAFLDRALVLAEIELEHADEPVTIPEWLAAVLDREVTDEQGYSNFELAR